MRSVSQAALSLALLMFVSCDSPAQEQSPTSIAPVAKAVEPADDPSSVEAGFAGQSGLASEAGLAGGAVTEAETEADDTARDAGSAGGAAGAGDGAEATGEGRIDAVTVTPPANTTPEQPVTPTTPHTTARAEVPPVDLGNRVDTATTDPRDEKIFELTERVAALQTEIEELKLRLSQLENIDQRVADLQLAVDGLATAEGGPDAGRRALGAMSESPQLRGEIAEKLQGKVRLVNNTGSEQVVYINGTPWTVVTGNSYVFAPVGKVSFQFIGQAEPIIKGIQEWEANPTSNQMELVVNLSAPTEESVVTRRPVTLDTGGPQK